MSTNNREFDFFALMASLEAHMLKDPNVRDASPSEALENYFSRKGKRSQRRKNAFRAQRHRRDVMAEKFDTTSKNDGILRKTYKDGYAKFESSHGRVKKEDKSNSYHCKHPRERRRIEAANSKLADYMQSDICLDLYDSVFDDDDDYDTYMGQLFYDNLVYFLCEESGWSEEDLHGIGIVEMMDIAYELGAGEKLVSTRELLLFRAMCGLMMGIFLSSGCMTVLVARQKSFWMFAAPIFMMITRTGIIPWILIVNLKGE